jgi:non-heme chloroperoxidase
VSRPATVELRSGLRLSCAEQGEAAAPAVVMLPGPTDSWRSYRPVLDRLPLQIRAIAVSQRGHGDSDAPASGYSVHDFAGDVVDLLDALELESPVLVAHSGSCLWARQVALDDPDRVAGLVLEASPTNLRFDAARRFVSSVVADLADPIDPAFVRSFVVDTSSGTVDPELVEVLVAEALKVPARVWHDTFAGLLEHDDTPELGRIDAATLLVWGEQDDLVSREMQDVLFDRIPGAELVTHPYVGHTPRWENPQRFADDLVSFVDRLPTG